MPVGGTTVGPLTTETRDQLAAYRDSGDYSNYDEALRALLTERED